MASVDWKPEYHALIGLTAVTCFLFLCFLLAIVNRLFCKTDKNKSGGGRGGEKSQENVYLDLEEIGDVTTAGHVNAALERDHDDHGHDVTAAGHVNAALERHHGDDDGASSSSSDDSAL